MGNRCSELSECFSQLHYNAPISSIPHLNDFDIDLPLPSNTNFRYLTTHDFHSDYEIGECLKGKDCFAALHCNIILGVFKLTWIISIICYLNLDLDRYDNDNKFIKERRRIEVILTSFSSSNDYRPLLNYNSVYK